MKTWQTTVHLIRHGEHTLGDHVLAGRSDVALSAVGRGQIIRLAMQPWVSDLVAIQASPTRRARETAEILANAAVLDVTTCDGIDEIDFGYWSGRLFAELEDDPWWRLWNARRENARTPGGETMVGVQQRVWSSVGEFAQRWKGAAVAVVTHAEIIRALLLAAHGVPISRWHSISVPIGSVHRITVQHNAAADVCHDQTNERAAS